VNRAQELVLGFFVVVWVSLVVILVVTPEIYDQALRLSRGRIGVELGLLAALSGFIGLLESDVQFSPDRVTHGRGVVGDDEQEAGAAGDDPAQT
jgi:hypothetical protein